MTDAQKETLNICLESILKFFEYGKRGCVAVPGGFAYLFSVRFPEEYETNKEFIWVLDSLIMACYRAGKNSADTPPG